MSTDEGKGLGLCLRTHLVEGDHQIVQLLPAHTVSGALRQIRQQVHRRGGAGQSCLMCLRVTATRGGGGG